ncbi:MAG: ATPase, partial [Eubacteriales bacterium]|nr:ATPase [Eubacteriales bacterium]
MIEKMQFLSITGPKADFDRVVDTYLSKYEMHLENALTEVKNAQGIAPFIEENPHKEEIAGLRAVLREYGQMMPDEKEEISGLPEALEITDALSKTLSACMEKKKKLKEDVAVLEDSYKKIVPFIGLNYNIREILHFDSIKYSFGRMPVEYYKKMQDY